MDRDPKKLAAAAAIASALAIPMEGLRQYAYYDPPGILTVPGLPDHVLAAFADAVYNIGPRIACDSSRSNAARLLKSGRHKDACRELPKWNKASVGGSMVPLPGLTKRRAAEMTLCLGEDNANP